MFPADRSALIGYLPGGFAGVDAYAALVDGGVDILEVGLPYTDPVMDGPVIQRAVQSALDAKTTTRDVLATVDAVVRRTGKPTLVMTYWNPIERYGPDAFARDLAAAGARGAITPDLLPEEADEWITACDQNGIDAVFVVAPTSSDERLAYVGGIGSGFVYAASTMGVTGARAEVGDRAADLVARVRKQCDLPVAVGLGVSGRGQAAEVAAYADGVIVGSAFVRLLLDDPANISGLAALATDLAAGVRG